MLTDICSDQIEIYRDIKAGDGGGDFLIFIFAQLISPRHLVQNTTRNIIIVSGTPLITHWVNIINYFSPRNVSTHGPKTSWKISSRDNWLQYCLQFIIRVLNIS